MGFETKNFTIIIYIHKLFELCPYGIWNSVESKEYFDNIGIFELCPYGIWNDILNEMYGDIKIFELCPYGIWNKVY